MKKKDSNLSSSYDKQIGGSHYLKYKIQPSKFVIENKLLFPEASVIKYIVRHQDKDGKKDLLKAIHFIEMIIERDYKEIKQESWVEGFRKWKREIGRASCRERV